MKMLSLSQTDQIRSRALKLANAGIISWELFGEYVSYLTVIEGHYRSLGYCVRGSITMGEFAIASDGGMLL